MRGAGRLPWERSSSQDGGAGASALAPFSFVYDGDNVNANGDGNAGFANGSFVPNWKNSGQLAGQGDADSAQDGSGDAWKPTFEADALNGRDAVAFDGIADNRAIAGSQQLLSFMHRTGAFHLVVVLRSDAALFQAMLANTSTTATKGFLFVREVTGRVTFYLLRGVGGTNNCAFSPAAITLTVGEWCVLEVAGDGASVYMAKNFGAFSSTAYANLPFSVGDANNRTTIGGSNDGAGIGSPFDGGLALIGLATRQLTTVERAAVQALVLARYGVL